MQSLLAVFVKNAAYHVESSDMLTATECLKNARCIRHLSPEARRKIDDTLTELWSAIIERNKDADND